MSATLRSVKTRHVPTGSVPARSVPTRSVPTRSVWLEESLMAAAGSVLTVFVVVTMLQSRLTTTPPGTGTVLTAAPLVGIGQLGISTSRSCVVTVASATMLNRERIMDTTASVAGQDTPLHQGRVTTGQGATTFV